MKYKIGELYKFIYQDNQLYEIPSFEDYNDDGIAIDIIEVDTIILILDIIENDPKNEFDYDFKILVNNKIGRISKYKGHELDSVFKEGTTDRCFLLHVCH